MLRIHSSFLMSNTQNYNRCIALMDTGYFRKRSETQGVGGASGGDAPAAAAAEAVGAAPWSFSARQREPPFQVGSNGRAQEARNRRRPLPHAECAMNVKAHGLTGQWRERDRYR